MSQRSPSRPRNWQDLSTWQRLTVIATIIIQITLLIAALRDIRRRPAAEIRGPKALWTAIAFINYIGPIAYFIYGRRKTQ
jgi:hypothetical protein